MGNKCLSCEMGLLGSVQSITWVIFILLCRRPLSVELSN